MSSEDYAFYLHIFSDCSDPECPVHRHLDWQAVKQNCQSRNIANPEKCEFCRKLELTRCAFV